MSDMGYDAVQEASQDAWKAARQERTGKLRLEDLEVVTWEDNPVIHVLRRPATVADWVEVGRQLGAEAVETLDATGWVEDWIVPVRESGRYLVYRLEDV